MVSTPTFEHTPALLAAADLQDHLLSACNDLERLHDLLSDACSGLIGSFHGALDVITRERAGGGLPAALEPLLERIERPLGDAVTSLQFQDLSAQLIEHVHRRLRGCAERLARDTFAGDEDGDAQIEDAPLRPNPVTQGEMDIGSIELF